ncbi:MAG: HAD-IA family hydrolase, partial [Pseudomonadota bacterium]
FNKAWEKLPPWADCVVGLTSIKKNAIIAPCSNGSIALMTRLAKFGSLPWDCILGAEVAGNYKPHPDSYLKSVAALSLEPEDVVMVAAHNSDLHAARECGLQTAFIPRPTEYGSGQSIDLEPDSDWDYVVETIGELASI